MHYDDEQVQELLTQEINAHYTYLVRTYGSNENELYHPIMTPEILAKGSDLSEETFLVIQDMLAKTTQAKANLPINAEIPVDYLIENAKMEGAIRVLREILNLAHSARHAALRKKLNLAQE